MMTFKAYGLKLIFSIFARCAFCEHLGNLALCQRLFAGFKIGKMLLDNGAGSIQGVALILKDGQKLLVLSIKGNILFLKLFLLLSD